jgi:hypothetical protein
MFFSADCAVLPAHPNGEEVTATDQQEIVA